MWIDEKEEHGDGMRKINRTAKYDETSSADRSFKSCNVLQLPSQNLRVSLSENRVPQDPWL